MCQIKIVVHGLNVIAGEKTAGEPSTNNDATDPDIDVDIAGVCQLRDKVQVAQLQGIAKKIWLNIIYIQLNDNYMRCQ